MLDTLFCSVLFYFVLIGFIFQSEVRLFIEIERGRYRKSPHTLHDHRRSVYPVINILHDYGALL